MKVLCPTAYKEGWATYAEHYAANLYGTTDSKDNLIMRYRVKKFWRKDTFACLSI